MTIVYRRSHDTDLQIGDVLFFEKDRLITDKEVVKFICPCGLRDVFVFSPPHQIIFNEEGLLTLKNSCAKNINSMRCHFHMNSGEIQFCDDSTCPGSKM